MQAKDVMTTKVVTVQEDTPVDDVVRTLLRWRISAVPVVDDHDRLVGIVSEGDLVRRAESDSKTDEAWWLSSLLDPGERSRRYAKARGLLAKDVMTTPVITAGEKETLAGLAALLERNRIKRVPITRSDRIIGIVSRANLLHGVASSPDRSAEAEGQPPVEASRKHSKTSDRSVRAEILNTLHNEIGVAHAVNVIVSNGVVDLWGGVETEAERQAVRTAAENAPGVTTVRDHLSVLPQALRHLLGADRADKG
jgi:CBS-domain-containing membrane protein